MSRRRPSEDRITRPGGKGRKGTPSIGLGGSFDRKTHSTPCFAICALQHETNAACRIVTKGNHVQGLGKTTLELVQLRKHWKKLLSPGGGDALTRTARAPASSLVEITSFGSNPGNLRMLTFVPDRLVSAPPLVVVLHGCTQTGRGYEHGAGWSTLARRHGFALLVPEQQRENNPNLCFNWFQTGDMERGRGEPSSIKQMIDWMIAHDKVDPARVFVTGLSAGGAMTSIMLAAYPDVFAGGAIIAGLPYGSAANVQQAFQSMAQGGGRSHRQWGDLVRDASPHRGPWPTVSVWHGDADATVRPVNAGDIVKQWTDVHGLSAEPSRTETVDGHPHRVWCDRTGRVLVEDYTIRRMQHGTPLSTACQETGCGAAGPFLLDVGISSSYHIAESWGLTGRGRDQSPAPAHPQQPEVTGEPREAAVPERAEGADARGRLSMRTVESIINNALKAAGLLK